MDRRVVVRSEDYRTGTLRALCGAASETGVGIVRGALHRLTCPRCISIIESLREPGCTCSRAVVLARSNPMVYVLPHAAACPLWQPRWSER